MNIIGIIAEYNPFHRGHAYQIETLKKICHADYVIIAMSGNFVQRGAPALMEKYSRTEMALHCGADLVLELPTLFATASAETFARGGVSLLNSTGIVTHLGFGAETDNIRILSELANLLCLQPEPYREALHRELKTGNSFPAARAKALETYLLSHPSPLSENADCFFNTSDNNLQEILASPNNILALEYLKALNTTVSGLIPIPILRQGNGYHDTTITEDFCSASAIRTYLKGEPYQKNTPNDSDNYLDPSCTSADLLKTAMPLDSYKILKEYPHPFLFEDDFSTLLHYELLLGDVDRLAAWGDSSPALARRLLREREYFTNWSEFCQRIKTKNITHTRINRLCLHMLLDIKQSDYQTFPVPSYLRILGFRKTAGPLLSTLKSHSKLPILTDPKKARTLLSTQGQKLWEIDLRAADLYRLGLTAKGDYSMKREYRRQIVTHPL